MKRRVRIVLATLALLAPSPAPSRPRPHPPAAYLGFDRNEYPGDANLAALRRTFAFTSYWLSNPPGSISNGWRGKRETVERAGFGFLLLFNGRDYADLKSSSGSGAARIGAADGAAAIRAAREDGFRPPSVIFLDQEQGGRMLPEQKQYVFAWADAVRRAGFRPGIYCSGIPVPESGGGRISTAQDLHDSPEGSRLVFWVAQDACPPSPGCVIPRDRPGHGASEDVLEPEASGVLFAEVWQFAQSPVRRQFASACRKTYAADGNCYPPDPDAGTESAASRNSQPASGRGSKHGGRSRSGSTLPLHTLPLHLDLNFARSADPSQARR